MDQMEVSGVSWSWNLSGDISEPVELNHANSDWPQ